MLYETSDNRYNIPSDEDVLSSIQYYYPTSKNNIFKNKFNSLSVIYKLIQVQALVFKLGYTIINTSYKELTVLNTNDLISNWENQVGIPDEIFNNYDLSLQDRINQVLIKLKSRYVNKQDFLDIAALLNLTVTIKTRSEQGEPDTKENRFRIWINILNDSVLYGGLPLTLKFDLPGDAIITSSDVLKRIYQRIKPVNVEIIYTS